MPHDDQDPPNDREREKRSKRRKDVRESSSKSSKKDKAPIDFFGSVDAAKRKSNWFDMVLKSNIDQDKDCILGLSTVTVANKIKELVKKDEQTIANLEGVGHEMLKRQYKNLVKLEYHVDQLKAAMVEEAQWSNRDSDLSKPRSFEKQMSKSRWSKEVHLYHVDALNGTHHWDDMRKDFFKAKMCNRSTHKFYSDERIIIVVQEKLHHLKLEFENDFINALLLYIRRVPKFNLSGIDHKIPYTTCRIEKGVVYLNKYDVKSLMHLDEVHKFCDGTLLKVQDNLLKMVNENKLGRGNIKLEGGEWTKSDIKRSKEMLEKIDKTLMHREQLRRLEDYVGGRSKIIDTRLFVRP
ncbi:hypothetical protein Tco_0827013 [Tanacetum coccineum]